MQGSSVRDTTSQALTNMMSTPRRDQDTRPSNFSPAKATELAANSSQPSYSKTSAAPSSRFESRSESQPTTGLASLDPPACQPQATDDQSHDALDNPTEPYNEEIKRSRACASCRGLKVRCDQDPEHPEIPCKRCFKAGRPCIITEPSRKRVRKADTRVAELEKKLDALTAALTQQHPGITSATAHVSPLQQVTSSWSPSGLGSRSESSNALQQSPSPIVRDLETEYANKRQRKDGVGPQRTSSTDGVPPPSTAAEFQRNLSSSNIDAEKLAQGSDQTIHAWGHNTDLRRFLSPQAAGDLGKRIDALVDANTASTIFNQYVTRLAPVMPAIVLPPGTTAESLKREKPILYLSIMSAASWGIVSPGVFDELRSENIGAIADCVIRYGAKSLEFVQAIQIAALWYKPRVNGGAQTNFYQIVHMGAVMALDIGLGKRFNPAKSRRGFGGPKAHFAPGPGMVVPQDSDTLEARRAWLCSYYLSASTSMCLRRPNLIRWTNYMRECVEVLESHPDAPASDRLFCQHVKIQRICEDIGQQFLMDDSTATISITDPKVTYALHVLENDLRSWRENIPPECRTPVFEFFEHVTNLYLHEIALHINHNVDDFKLPFTEESLKFVNNTFDKLTQHQMAALETCVKAAQGVLDTMFALDPATVMALPMLLYFPRCCYALVILIKLHVAITSPGSEVGKIIKTDELRVEYYADRLMALFRDGGKHENVSQHPRVTMVLTLLRDWFLKHKMNTLAPARAVPPPSASSASPAYQQQQHPTRPLVQEQQQSYAQTPLQLLSQVAASEAPDGAVFGGNASTWTIDHPYTNAYNRIPPVGHPDTRLPMHQQSAIDQHSVAGRPTPGYPATIPTHGTNQALASRDGIIVGAPNAGAGLGWGTGLEQAVDITMGGMDSLVMGDGFDDWFLGENMAPFAFNGDIMATSGWS